MLSIKVTLEEDEMVDVFMGCAIEDREIVNELLSKMLKCFFYNFTSKVLFHETLKNSSAPWNRHFDIGFLWRFPDLMTQWVHYLNAEIPVYFYDFFNLRRRRIVQRQVQLFDLNFRVDCTSGLWFAAGYTKTLIERGKKN